MCVTAFANRNDVWSNKGAEIGDALVLTKPLGVGVIVTASKAEMIDSRYFDGAVQSMITLNKQARNAARSLSVHAATDVTGFSLLGHGMQMAQASGVSLRIQSRSIPFLPGALEAASYGLLPEGMYHNLDYVSPCFLFFVSCAERKGCPVRSADQWGLLFSLPREDAEKLVASLPSAAIIGEIVPRGEKEIVID